MADNNGNGERKGSIYKFFLAGLAVLALAFFTMLWNQQDRALDKAEAAIAEIREKKLDKTEHYEDMKDIKDMFQEIKRDLRDRENKSRERWGK